MPRKYFDPDTGEEVATPSSAQFPSVKLGGRDPGVEVNIPRLPGNIMAGVNTTGQRQPRANDLGLPPPPTMSSMDNTLANVGDTVAWAGRTAKAVANAAVDPEAIGGLVGGAVGGMGGPATAVLGAGAGGAAVRLGRNLLNKKPTTPADLGESFLTQGAAEGGARMLSGLATGSYRANITPEGQNMHEFFQKAGVPTMAHQMADSPTLTFMGNMAKHGSGGEDIIKGVEQQQSDAVMDYLKSKATDMSSSMEDGVSKPGGLTIDAATGEFDRATAGKKVQQDLQSQLKSKTQGTASGWPQFMEQHGGLTPPPEEPILNGAVEHEPGMADWLNQGVVKAKGKPVQELHAQRSEVLADARSAEKAQGPTWRTDQRNSLIDADRIKGKIDSALPDDARKEYEALLTNTKQNYRTLDNPTVKNVRRDMKSDEVIDNILNGKLKSYADPKTGVGHSNTELLSKVQQAASPEAWRQLQADSMWRAAERSVDKESGHISFDGMTKVLGGMDDATKKQLFGNGYQDINKTLGVMRQAEKYTDNEAGRLFIAIRQGGAAASIGSALMTGNIGTGVAGAAMILKAPKFFAQVLTSPTWRPLLVQAFSKSSTTEMRNTAVQRLARLAAHSGAEEAREDVSLDESNDSPSASPDYSIEDPPKTGITP